MILAFLCNSKPFLFLSHFFEENNPSCLTIDWDTDYINDGVIPDEIIEDYNKSNLSRLPFLKATKQLTNWVQKKVSTFLFFQYESYD